MPCCGLPPGERLADRMTLDPDLVTCVGAKAKEGCVPGGRHMVRLALGGCVCGAYRIASQAEVDRMLAAEDD